MDAVLKELVSACAAIFGDDLVCILLLGSVQKKDTTPFSDIDLIGVVRQFDIERVAKVRSYFRSFEKLIDFSLIVEDEIPKDSDTFRMGTHGCYQLALVFAKARCLYGENVFAFLPRPSDASIRESMFEKIAEYAWWARRLVVEANRPRSIGNNYQLNSRLIKMVRDYLYLVEGEDIHGTALKTIEKLLDKFKGLFNEEEEAILVSLARSEDISNNAGNMSDQYLLIRVSIANKLYRAALLVR